MRGAGLYDKVGKTGDPAASHESSQMVLFGTAMRDNDLPRLLSRNYPATDPSYPQNVSGNALSIGNFCQFAESSGSAFYTTRTRLSCANDSENKILQVAVKGALTIHA
jgi:hypothetical protein